MPASPDIKNYYIGKGNVYFKPEGGAYAHMGNVPEYEFTPEIEQLEHFSSMAGIRTRDRTEVLELSGSLRIVLEEWTISNLKLAMLGTSEVDSVGTTVMQIFNTNAIRGSVKFVGTNEVGNQFEVEFLQVDFIPGSSVNFISEEWGQLEITGECGKVGDTFGTVKWISAEDDSESESDPASDD